MTSELGTSGTTTEEFDLKVYGDTDEEKIKSVTNSIGEQSTLLLIAIGDCVANKKSQVKIARKYDIPKSCIQRIMSRK